MTGAVMTAKAVAFVTRPSPSGSGTELLVFQHPMAGVQLPAGSMFDGEDAADGCVREVFEETGLDDHDVELVKEIGTWPEPASGLERHAFHLRCLRDSRAQWWVVTPDGDGLCWRCHWIPLDGTEPLHPAQRPWLDRVRGALVDHHERGLAPWGPLPSDLVTESTVEVFFAPPAGARWYSATWLPGDEHDDEDAVRQSIGFAVTAEGSAVIVTHQDGGEFIPGGTRETGETPRETLERELREEACVRVVDAELLGHFRAFELGADGTAVDVHVGSRWWTRVELDPWEPEWEMASRRLVPYTDVLGELAAWRFPANERWITAAIDAERARRP